MSTKWSAGRGSFRAAGKYILSTLCRVSGYDEVLPYLTDLRDRNYSVVIASMTAEYEETCPVFVFLPVGVIH